MLTEKPKIERAGVKVKRKSDVKWEPYKTIILNSGIDFSKFGWVHKVSKILNISPQLGGKWVKRYLPEQYDISFKRKSKQLVSPLTTNQDKGNWMEDAGSTPSVCTNKKRSEFSSPN